MNLNVNQNRFYIQAVLVGSLLLGLILFLWNSLGLSSDADAPRRANSTRTAIALTEQALLGPFPTATGPTPTASSTPTMAFTPTVTRTNTPTFTPFRYFINTATPRTPFARNAAPSLPTSTSPALVSTSTPPPPAQPTNTSAPPPILPTNPPPTSPPQPTSPPSTSAPQPTPPSAAQPTPCLNPQGHPVPCH